MSKQQLAIAKGLIKAYSNKSAASEILADPAAYFRAQGADLPEAISADFNAAFFKREKPNLAILRNIATDNDSSTMIGQENLSSVSCGLCYYGIWTFAAALVAAGAAALAELTVDSAVVISIAEFLGLDAEVVLEFLQTLADKVEEGTDAVACTICVWSHACSSGC